MRPILPHRSHQRPSPPTSWCRVHDYPLPHRTTRPASPLVAGAHETTNGHHCCRQRPGATWRIASVFDFWSNVDGPVGWTPHIYLFPGSTVLQAMFLGSLLGPRPKSSLTSPSYARLPRPPCHLAPGQLAWLTCRSFRLAAVMHCWMLHRPASDSSSDTSPSLCSLGHHDNCDPLPRHPLHLVRSHLLGLGLHPRSTCLGIVTAQSPDRKSAIGKVLVPRLQ